MLECSALPLSRLKALIKNFKTDWEIKQQCCSIPTTKTRLCVFPHQFTASLGGNAAEGRVLGWELGAGQVGLGGLCVSSHDLSWRPARPEVCRRRSLEQTESWWKARLPGVPAERNSLPLSLPLHHNRFSGSACGAALVEYQAASSLPHQKRQRQSAECSSGSGVCAL